MKQSKTSMIIVKTFGGLGNQLFQYAFARYYGISKKENVKLDNGFNLNKHDTYRQYSLNNFNIALDIANKDEVLSAKYPYGPFSKLMRLIRWKMLGKYNIDFDKNILNSKLKYFEGYWQNYKYLGPVRETLLKELTLKESIEEKFSKLLISMSETNSVSIHIRRGDYVNNPKTKEAHCTFGLEYYTDAIKLITSKINQPSFFIFSDDIDWAKNNLAIDFPTTFVSNPNIKDYEELVLMSKCKNNIIANSSFSFWSAWLNQNPNKIVIAPKKWNNKFVKEYEDMLPTEWLKI